MSDKMREALCDAAMQPTLDEIVKATIAHGVEDAPNPKNEMRHKRIASMVRALFAERWQAAQSEQSVPVVGDVVAWRWRYAQKSEEALATVCFGKPQWESDKVFDGIPSDEAIQRALLKGVVPEYLYRKPTHSITTAELEQLRKEYEQKQALLLDAHCERVSSLQERIRQLEAERVPIALERTGPDWPEIWLLQGWNCSVRVAAEALRFLVENEIPTGGEAYFGYAHLLHVANDLDKTVSELLCFNAAATQQKQLCPKCGGSGEHALANTGVTEDDNCRECAGSGYAQQPKKEWE